MDLLSLVARLTLDSSEYMKSLDEAKKAAEDAGKEIKKTLDDSKKTGGKGSNGGNQKSTDSGSSSSQSGKSNIDRLYEFVKYITEHQEDLGTASGKLETLAGAFLVSSADSKNGTVKAMHAFVEYMVDNKGDLDTTSDKLATFAGALGAALQTSDDPLATGAGKFLEYIAKNKDDLGTVSGNLATFAGALGQALLISDDPMTKGAGKFLEYIADHKDDFNSVSGVITTLAGGLGEALKESDNEGVALAGDFMSYMAQNAANLTSPVGVVMTLLMYLVTNWDKISAFFSSVVPEWILNLPGQIAEAWNNVMNAIQGALDKLREFFKERQSDLTEDDPMNDGSDDWFQYNPTDQGARPWASGLDYVPRNGYRSILHEGEAVLNKEEATAWRRGGNGGASASDIANALLSALEGMAVTMDGAQVGRLTAKTVSREIEREARAGRFAYA